jgi:hypothetical protein
VAGLLLPCPHVNCARVMLNSPVIDRAFDIRVPEDRERLADLLPVIDGRSFSINQQDFLDALESLNRWLRFPERLVYQWGILGPIPTGRENIVLSIDQAVELGQQLLLLETLPGFDRLTAGFQNPRQFEDTRFEAKVGATFVRLPAVRDLTCAPEVFVRGRQKRADFRFLTVDGETIVECKQIHRVHLRASRRMVKQRQAIASALDRIVWPDDLRLEVEVTGPFRESDEAVATRIVSDALAGFRSGRDQPMSVGPTSCFVVSRDSPFRLTDIRFGIDQVVLPSGVSTGLFNPKVTCLRIVNPTLEAQERRAIGAALNDALRQLPVDRHGLICLGGTPARLAEVPSTSRLGDPAYVHVRAIVIADGPELKFIAREADKGFVERLVQPR